MSHEVNTHNIGKKIKQLRLKNGLSQVDLAKELEITSQAVSDIERNANSPNALTIIKICKFFNVSSDYILSLDNEKSIEFKEIIDLNLNPDDYIYVEGLAPKELNNIRQNIDIILKLKEKRNSIGF